MMSRGIISREIPRQATVPGRPLEVNSAYYGLECISPWQGYLSRILKAVSEVLNNRSVSQVGHLFFFLPPLLSPFCHFDWLTLVKGFSLVEPRTKAFQLQLIYCAELSGMAPTHSHALRQTGLLPESLHMHTNIQTGPLSGIKKRALELHTINIRE